MSFFVWSSNSQDVNRIRIMKSERQFISLGPVHTKRLWKLDFGSATAKSMEVYWSVHTWSLVAGLEARLEISLGEARLLSDSVNMCFYEAVHTRRLLPAISSLLASHWLVGVTLEPMSDQAEFSSTWSPSWVGQCWVTGNIRLGGVHHNHA